jgi:hypothetical protein
MREKQRAQSNKEDKNLAHTGSGCNAGYAIVGGSVDAGYATVGGSFDGVTTSIGTIALICNTRTEVRAARTAANTGAACAAVGEAATLAAFGVTACKQTPT